MKAVEILKAGRELIADPARWTRNAFARDKDGDPTGSTSTDAVCWCSLGALNKVVAGKQDSFEFDLYGATEALSRAFQIKTARWDDSVSMHNDNNTHEVVLSAWDKAIEMLETTAEKVTP